MPERAWKLGEDLCQGDNLLDGVTFGELIMQLHCNLPKDHITPYSVRRELNELLSIKFQDMEYLLDKNMGEIIRLAKK